MEKKANRLTKEFWRMSSIARKKAKSGGFIKSRQVYADGINKGNENIAKRYGIKINRDPRLTPNQMSNYRPDLTQANIGTKAYEPLEPAISLRHEIYEGVSAMKAKARGINPINRHQGRIAYEAQSASPLDRARRRINRNQILKMDYDTLTNLKYKPGQKIDKNMSNQLYANRYVERSRGVRTKRVSNVSRHQGLDVLVMESNLLRSTPHQNLTRMYRKIGSEGTVVSALGKRVGVKRYDGAGKVFGVDKFSGKDMRKFRKVDTMMTNDSPGWTLKY